MSDIEQAVFKSNAYKIMIETWAFRDLMDAFQKEREDQISQLLCKKGAEELDKIKGFDSALNFVKSHISYSLGNP